MKKVLLVLVILGVCVGGCSVYLSPTYSTLLDETAALSANTATRAEANSLTPDQIKSALRGQANVWQRFRDARDGVAGKE